MGQELECRIRVGRRSLSGKAYLETDHILFRGPERIKISLKDLKAVTAADGVLHLDYPDGPAAFELGKAAERWAAKILHPPTRAAKLGVKAGLTFRLCGEFDAGFVNELIGLERVGTRSKADLIFLLAPTRTGLDQVGKLAGSLTPSGALWFVYPKGVKEIREIEVIEAGRSAGLKDVKVAGFSATHTGLKFVLPLASR